MPPSSMQTDSSTTFVLINKSPRRHIQKDSNLKKRKPCENLTENSMEACMKTDDQDEDVRPSPQQRGM